MSVITLGLYVTIVAVIFILMQYKDEYKDFFKM